MPLGDRLVQFELFVVISSELLQDPRISNENGETTIARFDPCDDPPRPKSTLSGFVIFRLT